MIALRSIHGKIGKSAFTIIEGRSIPEHLTRHLDMKRLIAEGVIKDDKKPVDRKNKEPSLND